MMSSEERLKEGCQKVYTQDDLLSIKRQKTKRMVLVAIPAVLLFAGVIVSFIFRVKYVTMGLSVVLGAYIIFFYELFVAPVAAYQKHIDNALNGRTRSLTGAFKEMESTAVMREGVRYYPLLLNVGDMDSPEDDRLFYYDCNLPLPEWKTGDLLTVTAHDKAMTAWVRASTP